MMNWLRARIQNWLNNDQDLSVIRADFDEDLHIRTEQLFSVKVYAAVGGKVLEFTRVDRKNDDYQHYLYVINDEADFSQELARYISLEVLKS
jgi:hypothetical protein